MTIEKMQEDKEPKIATVKEAVSYLNRQAWKLSEKSMYRHMSEGKIKRPPWIVSELDLYAAEYLRPAEQPTAATPSKMKKSAQELIKARREKIKIEIETKNFELELKRGNYIENSEHVRLFCVKALLLKDAAYNWIYENHRELIRACNGDEALYWDLIRVYHEGFESYWARCDIGVPIRMPREDISLVSTQGVGWW